jgi:hypothetical protein
LEKDNGKIEKMETITRSWQKVRRDFNIFTVEEATQLGMKWCDWREAKVGEWVETDDGYVVECLGENFLKKGKKVQRMVVLSIGCGMVGHTYIRWLEKRESRKWWRMGNRDWIREEITSTRGKNAISCYVAMLLNGGVIDWRRLGLVYRHDAKIPEATARRFFKDRIVRAAVKKEFQVALKEEGLDYKFLITVLKKAVQVAEKREQPAVLLEIVREMSEMLDTKK